jgi:hypothetical protein
MVNRVVGPDRLGGLHAALKVFEIPRLEIAPLYQFGTNTVNWILIRPER